MTTSGDDDLHQSLTDYEQGDEEEEEMAEDGGGQKEEAPDAMEKGCAPSTSSSKGLTPCRYERTAMEPESALQGCTKDLDCRSLGWSVFKALVSVTAHLGFVGSLVVVVWSQRQDARTLGDDTYYRYYLIASSVAGGLYIVMLVEAAACDTYMYVRCFHPAMAAEDYVDRVRDARPLIRWRAECYHYDVRPQTRLQRNQKGQVNVRQLRHREKVITHQDTEVFRFDTWKDLSRDIKGFLDTGIVRVESSKVFLFRDDISKAQYMQQYVHFRERNRRRDEFMEHVEEFVLPGYRERLMACVRGHVRPCWLRELWFWVFTMALLTWPYRWLVHSRTTKLYVVFIKELEV